MQPLVLAVMIIANTVLTYQRNKVWKMNILYGRTASVNHPLNRERGLIWERHLPTAARIMMRSNTIYKSIELNPKDEMAFVDRAKSKIDLSDCNGAAADLSYALQINPDFYDANVRYG